MPRNYKAKPGTRRYKSCDNSKLQKALNRVVAGESQRSLCVELNIPRSTLYNKLKKKDTQKPGRPTVLNEEELSIAEHLLATADWGFPFDGMDIMMLVKSYLDKIDRTVALFKNNLPVPEWLEAYLKRHSDMLRMRLFQNISSPKKKRKHQLPEEKDVDWMWRLAKVFKEVMKTRTWILTHLFLKRKE